MNTPRTLALATLSLALAGCGGPDATPTESQVSAAQPSVVTPVSSTPSPDCAVAPGEEVDAVTEAPETLVITCGERSVEVAGEFGNKVSNSYDFQETGIKSIVVVDNQVRIYHTLREQRPGVASGCLTIQSLDELSASRDDCDPERLAIWNERASSTPESAQQSV